MAKKSSVDTPAREQWTSKATFVMAAVGSAIGLGNIWMFPWRMGTYGGSAFLLIYLLIVAVIGMVGLMGEFALGRGQQKGPIGALDAIFREKKLPGGKILGYIPVLTTLAVTIFYMIVVGWAMHYVAAAFRGFAGVDLAAYFKEFAGTPNAVIWHIIAVVVTGAIVYVGVKKGLEPANTILMPALFLIMIVLVIRAVTLPGAAEGIRFILTPNFAVFADPLTWFHALSQALFSLSVFGSIMVIYGSYLPKKTDIPLAAGYAALFDTGAAVLAAFIVFPAAFAFGVTPGAGIPLMFQTLPALFGLMPAGVVFGVLFFLLVVFAAVTSAVSIFESAVEPMMDQFKWNRKTSTLVTMAVSLIVGLPLTLNMAWFSYWMRFTSAVLLPIGVLAVMIAIFWVYDISRLRKEINNGASVQMGPWWDFVAKYVVVPATTFILVFGSLRFFGILK